MKSYRAELVNRPIATLHLKDGTKFSGTTFGAERSVSGEVGKFLRVKNYRNYETLLGIHLRLCFPKITIY